MHLGERLQRFAPLMFVEIESLKRRRQPPLLFSAFLPLPNQLGEFFRFRFDAVRTVEPDESLRRQIRKNRTELWIKVRYERLHSGKRDTFPQRLNQVVLLPPVDLQLCGPP